MNKTILQIPMMDCPSEERLIRIALEGVSIERLDFDLGERSLTAIHEGSPEPLLELLRPLNLGARVVESGPAKADEALLVASPGSERSTLVTLLAINATMFLVELIAGLLWQSTGLIADSLDMLADAAVYAMSLYAVGKALTSQSASARFSGYVQMVLAAFVLIEVGRRFLVGSQPEGVAMMAVSVTALVANLVGMALIAKHRRGGLHMQASWIFTSTDVLANLGVVIAGGLVAWTRSPTPDLVIGLAIGLLVLGGAIKILRLTRRPTA